MAKVDKYVQSKKGAFPSGRMFLMANKAMHRAEKDHLEALTTIILSALAFESYINDLVALYPFFENPVLESHETLKHFSQIGQSLEKDKARITTKIDVLYYLLTKKKPDFGSRPLQDFKFLVSIRNKLVHRTPEIKEFDPSQKKDEKHPGFIEYLANNKIIKMPENWFGTDWDQMIENESVAKWAFQTAIESAFLFAEKFPDGLEGEHARKTIEGFRVTT